MAVTGFGPLNEGIQSAIDEAANSASIAATRNVVPALASQLTQQISSTVIPGLLRDPTFMLLFGRPAAILAGETAFNKAKPYLTVAAGSLFILALASVYRAVQAAPPALHPNPDYHDRRYLDDLNDSHG
jgi:hypothetical protein